MDYWGLCTERLCPPSLSFAMWHDFSWPSRYQWAGVYPEGCEIENWLKSVQSRRKKKKQLQTTSYVRRFQSSHRPKRATLLPTEVFQRGIGANVVTARSTICDSLPCHFRTNHFFVRSNTHRWNQQQLPCFLHGMKPQEILSKCSTPSEYRAGNSFQMQHPK